MATKPTKTVSRAKRTKQDLQQEMEALQSRRPAEAEDRDPKAAQLAREREAQVLSEVGGMTVESVVQKITGLGLEISRTLAGVSDSLAEQVRQLSTLQEGVRIEKTELDRLHQIDVAKTSLDQLLLDYEQQKQKLETEVEEQRAAWENETKEREKLRKEDEEALKKARQREIDEYEYKKNLERKKAQDKYDEEQRLIEKKNQEKQEALEKKWQEREAALKAQEEELARLKKESAESPDRLKKEVDRAAKEATQATEARLNQQLTLTGKEMEAEKRVAELRIRSLEETIARLNEQMAVLQKQSDEAKRQVQDIALKAIEGASGSSALAHINKIAMEQAKHRPPQG